MTTRTSPRAPTRSPGASEGIARLLTSAWLPALLVLATYARSLGYAFVWDDERLIANNPLLRTWPGMVRAMRSDFWLTVGQNASGFWRPLITASYAFDGILFRWQPWGFHLLNVLAAAGVAALVTRIARQFDAPPLAALAAGLWFAVMPHHVESTAWIAGRTDVYCALFFLLAMWFDQRDRAAGRRWPGAAALVTFALALLSKEAAVLFVAMVFVVHACRTERGPGTVRAALRWCLPYLALTAVYLAAHLALVPAAPPPHYLSADMLRRGRLSTWLMYPGYLSFLWPIYPHSPAVVVRLPISAADPGVIAGLVLQAATIAGMVVLFVRRSRWAIALLMLWITLLPTFAANLLQTYLLFSERFMYLPSVGAAWLLAFALAGALRRGRAVRAVALAGAAALVLAASVAAARILPDWRDDDSLYTSMTRRQPRNAMGWILIARLRLVQGRDQDAERALKMLDGLEATRPELLSVRALLHYRRGDWPGVLEFAGQAITLDPTLIEPRLARATALLRMGRMAETQAALDELRRLVPDNPMLHSLEGQRLLTLRRPAEALAPLLEASRWIHDDADLAYALGIVCAMRNDVPAARAAFADAVRIEPQLFEGWLRLATACQLLGDEPGRDAALARASALPEAADGRVAGLRSRLLAMPH